jgi:hypothetical protein
MSDWKVGFKRALIDAIIDHGEVQKPFRSSEYFSFEDEQKLRKHVQAYIDYDGTGAPVDSSYWTDGDSFQSGEERACFSLSVKLHGESVHVRFIYKGTFSELIFAVLS